MIKVITKAVFDMRSMTWIPELEESFLYDGLVAMCKETEEQKTAANNLQTMTTTLQKTFNTTFAGQQAILDNIDNSVKATIAAGPSQYGFSAQQDAALRTQADEGTAASYNAARQATGEQLAAIGGGNAFLPSGTAAVLTANTANKAAAQQASEQLGITEAGWQQGTQNYLNAIKAADTSAQLLNPAQYSGQSLSAAKDTFDAQTQIANEPTTAGVVGGILGSVAGSFAGGLGEGIGGNIGSKVCWVAAACFDEDFYTGTKTNLVRNWMWNTWSQNWYAKPVLALYTKYGQWVASKPVLVKLLKPLFNRALAKAQV